MIVGRVGGKYKRKKDQTVGNHSLLPRSFQIRRQSPASAASLLLYRFQQFADEIANFGDQFVARGFFGVGDAVDYG